MSAAARAYRLLLRAYPPAFREEYGGEMLLAFRDQHREGGNRVFRFWTDIVWDVMRSAPAERLDGLRGRRGRVLQSTGGDMKPMAMLAVLIGAVQVVNALTEGWVGGVQAGDGYSLAWAVMVTLAGVLFIVSGVAMLRRLPSATMWARTAAIGSLAAFACMLFIEPRLSNLAAMLGIAFPIALLLLVQFGRGPSAPMVA